MGVKNEKKIKKSKIEKKEVSDNCKIKCENDTSVGKNNSNLQFQLTFHSLSCVFDNDDGAGHIYFSFIKNIFTSGSILGGAGAVRHFQIPNSTRSPSRIRPRFDHHQIPKTQVLFFFSQFSSQNLFSSQNFPIFDPKLSFPS